MSLQYILATELTMFSSLLKAHDIVLRDHKTHSCETKSGWAFIDFFYFFEKPLTPDKASQT